MPHAESCVLNANANANAQCTMHNSGHQMPKVGTERPVLNVKSQNAPNEYSHTNTNAKCPNPKRHKYQMSHNIPTLKC